MKANVVMCYAKKNGLPAAVADSLATRWCPHRARQAAPAGRWFPPLQLRPRTGYRCHQSQAGGIRAGPCLSHPSTLWLIKHGWWAARTRKISSSKIYKSLWALNGYLKSVSLLFLTQSSSCCWHQKTAIWLHICIINMNSLKLPAWVQMTYVWKWWKIVFIWADDGRLDRVSLFQEDIRRISLQPEEAGVNVSERTCSKVISCGWAYSAATRLLGWSKIYH